MNLIFCGLFLFFAGIQNVSAIKYPDSPLQSNSFLEYDLILGGKDIGDYNIRKNVNGKCVEYIAHSKAEVKIIIKRVVEYTLICVFEDGVLVNSELKTYVNGKSKNYTRIHWSGDYYTVNKDGEITTIKEEINSCTAQLYFEHPEDGTTIFSEKEAKFKMLNRTKKDTYLLCDIGKKSGINYSFSPNCLDYINIDYVIASFSVVKK